MTLQVARAILIEPTSHGLARGKRGSQKVVVSNQESSTINFLNKNNSFKDITSTLEGINFLEVLFSNDISGYAALRFIENGKSLILFHFKGTKFFRYGILDIKSWKLNVLSHKFRCDSINKIVRYGLIMFLRWINR